jgi:hypothetical protein
MAKGVSIIFEHVLLFMIAVVIFIISFYTFRSYETYYADTVMEGQLREVSDWVASSIILLSEKGGADTKISLPAPRFVGRESYKIELTQNGINTSVLPSGKSVFVTLYGVNESFTLHGSYSSQSSGTLNLTKLGNDIGIT